MTRKQKPPPQSKRHAITDDTGWTHITKGPKSTINTQRTKRLLQQEKIRRESLSLETYSQKFKNHYSPRWRESSCYAKLKNILEDEILTGISNIKIMKCVCLGLGSPTAGVEVSSWELAALLSLLEILAKTHPLHTIIFQDPVFNATDYAFITSLGEGYRIVEDPDAFDMIDESTFIFAPHLEWVHLARVLGGERGPGLGVWGDVEGFVGDVSIAKKTSEDVHHVLKAYADKMSCRAMPEFEGGHNWCFFLCFYWLKSEEVVGGGRGEEEDVEQEAVRGLEELRL